MERMAQSQQLARDGKISAAQAVYTVEENK